MNNLEGRVAAITGAASGIGRALAINFAQRGCHVAISDVNETELAKTEEMVKAYGVNVTSQKLDVADKSAMHAWADQVAKDHGKVNIIINNAGVALVDTVEQVKYEDFEWIMGINFLCVVYGTKAFLPYIKSAGEGHIVNISSVFGIIAVPTQGTYNAAKFAVRGFTEALIEELDVEESPIKATCVHPGGIATNIAADSRVNEELESFSSKEKMAADFKKVARTSPDKAAKTIINGILKEKRRVLIGADAYVIDNMQRFLPTGYQKLLAMGTKRQQKAQAIPAAK